MTTHIQTSSLSVRFSLPLYGRPPRTPQDPKRCVVQVHDNWLRFWQCPFRRGKGPRGEYYGIHARTLERGNNVYVPGKGVLDARTA